MATYYNRRNKISMIIKYIEEKDIERYCKYLVNDLFKLIYSCTYQKKLNTLTTAVFACDDALNNCMGKAKPGRILDADIIEDRFVPLLKAAENVLIMAMDTFAYKKKCIKNLVDTINAGVHCKITVMTSDYDLPIDYKTINIINEIDDINLNSFDVRFYACEHIFKVTDFKNEFAYVDEYTNIAITNKDKKYCTNFESQLELFNNYAYPLFVDKIKSQFYK